MPCQGGSRRPEDACSKVLLIINRASVDGLPPVLRPVTPTGSPPPCGVGQSWNPYRYHYSTAFASSRVLYPLRLSPRLRLGDSVCLGRTESVSGLPRSARCTHRRG